MFELPAHLKFPSPADGANKNSQQKAMGLRRSLWSRAWRGAAALGIILASVGGAQADVLAGWDVHGLSGYGASPLAATSSDANVTVGGLTRGSGIKTTGTAAARAWGGNDWMGTDAGSAVTNADYATFTVTANAGYQMSMSSISRFDYRRSGTGPASGVLQYQVGSGAFTDVTSLGYSVTTSTGGTLGPIDLSGIAALQNLPAGSTVTFRIANYGGTSAGGTWYVWDYANSTANDLEISGTVTAAGGDVAPTVSATTPTNAAAGVAVNSNLTVTFSEPVTAAGNAFTLSCATSGVHTFALSNSASTTYTLNPDTDFANNEACTVTITAANVADQDGTPDNMAANYSFGFTTEAVAGLVNGACGSDHRQPLSSTPTNLCSTGTPSAVSGSGPWTWSCAGAVGGTTAYCGSTLAGNDSGFSVFHVNDTHARLTPHEWVIPSKGNDTPVYESVGGAAYAAGEMLALTANRPTNSLVIDGGDISEGNPVGDFSGSADPLTIGGITVSGCAPLSETSISSNCGMTQFYQMLSRELLAQRGRGMDAVVVGNHDVRDVAYIQNLEHLRDSGVPVLSVNVRDIATHQPHFAPYTIVNINGTRVGILGYTTQASEVGASLASTLEVVDCDWSASSNTTGISTSCHLSDYVNTLRNTEHVDVVVLVAHIGHGALVDQNPSVGANLLVDDGTAKLPEIVVTGHWHTWADTAWQPMELNYKSIFSESASYLKYIGELNVDGAGKYQSATQHVLRNSAITPDANVQSLVTNLVGQYNAAHTLHVYDVVGYTNDNLVLDNDMRWWSPDEYPWSGNNTAGQWITDAMRWKCEQLFGACDLAVEAGGGVRSDIPAGPVTMLQVYETFPWSDDTFVRVDMSGQDIVNFLKVTNMDAGFSSALDVTAVDGTPTLVKFNGQPIDLSHIYTVAINNYMYDHPPTGFTWPTHSTPLTDNTLMRDGIIEFMQSQHATPETAYQVGGPRYHLNGEFSGGYRAVVTMMDDQDTRPTFDAAFVRFLSATPDTLLRRGSNQVPADLVNPDGSVNAANRLSSMEIYRSHLGFKPGLLHAGDVIEFWGKASFYGGNPEFVDQEGIQSDGVEFKILAHGQTDLAKPEFVASVSGFLKDSYKNHYIKFLARKTASDTVTDQNNQAIKIYDATGYSAVSLPGNTNDVLEITGVLTMESYGFRFRSDSATVSALALPASTNVSSHIDATSGEASAPITLTSTAAITGGGYDLTPVADAQIESGSPTYNGGTGNNLYIQSSTSSYGNERAWLRFDLTSIPAGSIINGATLKLWNWKSTGESLPVEVSSSANDSWLETGVNWNNQPAIGSVLDTQTLASGTVNVWYAWDVTSFAQSEFAGDKQVSLVVKPVTESSTDVPAPSYGFDAKEYGSNAPVLHVTTQSTASSVANVKFYYRYSANNSTWGAWTQTGATDSVAPYTAGFSFPDGPGYYEFYSVATDNLGGVEPTPAYAQAAVHYQAASGDTQTVSFTQPSPVPAGSSFSLTASASSGLPVTFGSQTSSICTVSGDVVTANAAGTCTLTASQAGVVGYLLPASASRSFTVEALSQTITFAGLTDHALGSGTLSLSASASSGLDVQFSSLTTNICTVSGNSVSLLAAGTCSIAANQPGDSNFAAAPTVTQSFNVTAANGGGNDGDVPVPGWALALLGGGLLETMRRRMSRKQA